MLIGPIDFSLSLFYMKFGIFLPLLSLAVNILQNASIEFNAENVLEMAQKMLSEQFGIRESDNYPRDLILKLESVKNISVLEQVLELAPSKASIIEKLADDTLLNLAADYDFPALTLLMIEGLTTERVKRCKGHLKYLVDLINTTSRDESVLKALLLHVAKGSMEFANWIVFDLELYGVRFLLDYVYQGKWDISTNMAFLLLCKVYENDPNLPYLTAKQLLRAFSGVPKLESVIEYLPSNISKLDVLEYLLRSPQDPDDYVYRPIALEAYLLRYPELYGDFEQSGRSLIQLFFPEISGKKSQFEIVHRLMEEIEQGGHLQAANDILRRLFYNNENQKLKDYILQQYVGLSNDLTLHSLGGQKVLETLVNFSYDQKLYDGIVGHIPVAYSGEIAKVRSEALSKLNNNLNSQ